MPPGKLPPEETTVADSTMTQKQIVPKRFFVVSSGGNLAGGLGRKKKGFLLSTGKLLRWTEGALLNRCGSTAGRDEKENTLEQKGTTCGNIRETATVHKIWKWNRSQAYEVSDIKSLDPIYLPSCRKKQAMNHLHLLGTIIKVVNSSITSKLISTFINTLLSNS